MKSKTVIIYFAAALLASCTGQPQQQVEMLYESMMVRPSDKIVLNPYSASIRGKSDIAVMPQVSGYIINVCVEEGQKVHKGQQLFIIDQVPYIAANETAEANVSVAEAAVETARIIFTSKKELYNQRVVSEFEMLTSQNALTSAEAQLKLAKAQLRNAANNLSYTVVKSPSDGVIGTLPYKAGALVGPAIPVPLTTVSDNTEMYVYFSVTEKQLLGLLRAYESVESALNSMAAVNLELSDGSLFAEEGHIQTISGVIDQVTGAVSIKALFPNSNGLLHSGGSGNVIIPQKMENVFVIPKSATFEIQDKTYVYKVVDGITNSCLIGVNPTSTREEYIVESGLSEGDVIITEGVGFLTSGVPVNLK